MSELGSNLSPIGLIAGNRDLPLLVVRRAKMLGRPSIVIGIEGEADPSLEQLADQFIWVKLGELTKPLAFFKKAGVRDMVMIGGISRETLLLNYEPDDEAVLMMESLTDFQTDNLLRTVAAYLAKAGFTLRPLADILPELLTAPGLLTKVPPSPELEADLKMAWRIAKEMGRLDIGQTVVVSDLLTLAVEAAEGTDAAVTRGASLADKPVAVAKVVKPIQDFRLDPPVIGPDTIKVMAAAKVGALAVDASQTILIDREEIVRLAEEANLALVAWTDQLAGYGN